MKKELVKLRKRNEKHFLNDDGTIEAVVYNMDVHSLKNGLYEEINNTLIEKNNRYHIICNDFDLSFSKKSDNQLLEVNKSNHYFIMSLRDTCNVYNKELKKDKKVRKKGSIIYNDIYKNIDLNYKIFPKKIKETIIIKDKTFIKDKFIFDIKTDLELTLKNNKIISDDFILLEPFMFDSNNSINKEIYYILNKIDDGYELIMVLDKTWLECGDRVYPIYIDPTITTEELKNSQETYISSKYPDTNFGTTQILKTSIPTPDEICRSLIKFELPTISTGSNIVNAKMYLHECPYDYFVDTFYNSVMTVHNITSDWNENTATWNNMNDKYNSKIEDYIYDDGATEIIAYDAGWVNFDITNLVKRWYSGTPNYGLMLKIHNETFHEKPLCHDFMSKNYDNTTADPRPVLIITYRNKNGLESYLTYQKQILSNCIIYENNYNGNVTIDFALGKTVGGKMPVNLELFYNTNDVILEKDYGFGIGMQLNMHQNIRQSEITQSNINLYEYIDEDGTIHYFIPKKENDELIPNVFTDEDGLLLTLTITDNTCQLEDKLGNSKIFTKNNNVYYLTKTIDTENNEVTISYNDSKIVSITDSNNQQINIIYGLDNITIVSPVNTSILTISNNKLIKIQDNVGITNISYNNDNIVTNITDINGKKSFRIWNS